jgi:hypothetical protein
MTDAAKLIDGYRFGTLHPTAIEVGLRARAGIDQAFITGATARGRAHRGATLRVRLRLRHTGTGARETRTVRVRIPLAAPRGRRTLLISGTPSDVGGNPDDPGDLSVVFEDGDTGEEAGPESLAELRSAFEDLHRDTGVSATLAGVKRQVLNDPRMRITGEARLPLNVRP